MSGLFRRLASQALGLAPPLHSAAALPYAPPLSAEPPGESATGSSAAGPPISRLEPPRWAPPATAPSGEPEAFRRPEQSAPAAPSPIQRSPARAPSPSLPDHERRDLSAATTPSSRIESIAETPVLATPSRFDPPVPIAHALDPPSSARNATIAQPELLESQNSGSRPRVSAEAWLLPPRSREPRPRKPSLCAAGATSRAPQPATDPVEVHVHIGRIELTAVPAAPAPKPRRPRGPGGISLEDYLARRQDRRA